MDVFPSLFGLCLSRVADGYRQHARRQDVSYRFLPRHIKSYLLPVLCKRELLHDDNVDQFLHDQTSELDLSDCDISDVSLRHISICTRLQVLTLNASKGVRVNISSEGLQAVFSSCHSLRCVHLRRCLRVDDECVRTLAEQCPSLEVLNLHGCELVGDGGVEALAQHVAGLKSLDLSKTAVSEAAIITFATGASRAHIKELNLSHTMGPTDHAVFQLIQNCPNLKMLMLHSCPNVTGESRELLSQQNAAGSQPRKFQQITWTVAF